VSPRAAIAVALALTACGPGRVRPGPAAPVALSGRDVAYELAEDDDLADRRGAFLALEVGAPGRAELRRQLAGEYARRVDVELAAGRPATAHQALLGLGSLWLPAELDDPVASRDLTGYAGAARSIYQQFARSGGTSEAVAAQAMLIVMDPQHADQHRAEIDEIFAYADSLMVSMYGEGAERARPIEILEELVDAFPSRFVIDRLAELYVARQAAIDTLFRNKGADFMLIRAHGRGALQTSWNLLRIFALADRLGDALPYLASADGKLGEDDEVHRRAVAAADPQATVDDWIGALRALAGVRRGERDGEAELRLAMAISRRFPGDAGAAFTAASVAEALDRVDLAVHLYERGLAGAPAARGEAERLAGLYEAQLGTLVFADRPHAAADLLVRIDAFHRGAAARWPAYPLQHDLAGALATMGRGLVALGELDAAAEYLRRSLALRHNADAYEWLGVMALERDQFGEAADRFAAALALIGGGGAGLFQRARLLRLRSEAEDGAGRRDSARADARAALDTWAGVDPRKLPGPLRAILLVEKGKLLWWLGQRGDAQAAFDGAVDADPEGAVTHTSVVGFLVERSARDRALDAFHRALASQGIGDYDKVTMSLWLVAEARRHDQPPDPLAMRYLASRDGALWYDELARFAAGEQPLPARGQVGVRSRRAQLLYYAAMLGNGHDPERARLLEQVVATDAVMSFEYHMAKQWLNSARSRTPDDSPTR